jgi:methylmalonyl-CoA/ethylmalonyl-CoA epimerase
MSLRLSHIAIACAEIETAIKKLGALSLAVAETHEVPTEKVNVAMLPIQVSKHMRIELLEPTSADSPIAGFLGKRPNGGLHHLCFEVENLQKWQSLLIEKGLEILPPGIRPGGRGRALFIHPRCMAGVLVELEEIKP